MRTLRDHVEKWYDLALKEVVKIIKKRGYASWLEVHDTLQKRFTKFEKYYVEKYRLDPFSEEFVNKVFEEFFEKVRKIPGLNVVLLENGVTTPDGEREIYGFGDVHKVFYEKIGRTKRKKEF